MRTHGTLTKWNDDRGFGFITPANGAAAVFVHISAYPRDGVRPYLNELISFEVEPGPEGKPRAVRVMRARPRAAGQPAPLREPQAQRRQSRALVLVLLVVAGFGVYAYFQSTKAVPPAEVLVPDEPERFVSPPSRYACDGRTMCSQMTSCAEARYFIGNCPNTQMDGDRDGDPCESQWCN